MDLWPTPADEEAARECVKRLGREVLADSVLYHAFLAGVLAERARAAQVAEGLVRDVAPDEPRYAEICGWVDAAEYIADAIRKGPQP